VKQKWDIRRTLVHQTDGQRRWDIAYQRLLQWTREVASVADEATTPIAIQEAKDESCHLCSCVDLTTTTKPND
jgi:hypothetical protein